MSYSKIIDPSNHPTQATPREILNEVKMRLNVKYLPLGIKFSLYGWYEDGIATFYRLEVNVKSIEQRKNLIYIKHAIDFPYPTWIEGGYLIAERQCDTPQEFWDSLCLAVKDGQYIDDSINGLIAICN